MKRNLVDRLNLHQKMIDFAGPNTTCIPETIEAIESARRVEEQLLNAFGELFPTYSFSGSDMAIDLMRAEVLTTRRERDDALERIHKLELAVTNLRMLCTRNRKRYMSPDDVAAHAIRIAGEVGCGPDILRAIEGGMLREPE